MNLKETVIHLEHHVWDKKIFSVRLTILMEWS